MMASSAEGLGGLRKRELDWMMDKMSTIPVLVVERAALLRRALVPSRGLGKSRY